MGWASRYSQPKVGFGFMAFVFQMGSSVVEAQCSTAIAQLIPHLGSIWALFQPYVHTIKQCLNFITKKELRINTSIIVPYLAINCSHSYVPNYILDGLNFQQVLKFSFRRSNLYLRFAANSASREAGHVVRFSRPSDRPSGRPRSCFPQPFCKKALELKRNQPAVQVPLLENFAKKPSVFLKINPQSNSAG